MNATKPPTKPPTSKSAPADTIAAVATPPGRGGVGIVRVSGPHAFDIAQAVCQQSLTPRVATYTRFLDETTVVDQGIALTFKAPHSFTGEDVLELQGHGGPIVMDHLLRLVIQQGARLARPGEFSERAFLNDKLDLAQAEAIADLIAAQSDQAAQSAMQSLQGGFSKQVNAIVTQTKALRMYVEAAIDFPEEEVDFLSDARVTDDLQAIEKAIAHLLSTAKQGALLRDGITLAILGKPNVGKSSLLNALTQQDTAIVTDIAGTTRDVLREDILLDELPLQVVDTAGLRQSDDVVEQEGVGRAIREAEKADVLLVVTDAAAAVHSAAQSEPSSIAACSVALQPWVDVLPASLMARVHPSNTIIVHNKIDLASKTAGTDIEDGYHRTYLSVKTGAGLNDLKQAIKSLVGFHGSESGQFTARRRHLDALQRAHSALQTGRQQLVEQGAGELLAEELRHVQQSLSEITGAYTPDDLLGDIFSSFCIGK